MKNFFYRLCSLLTCLLMLAAIAYVRHGMLWGHPFTATSSDSVTDSVSSSDFKPVASQGLSDALSHPAPDAWVVNSTALASDVIGYAGPTPLMLYVSNGRIDSICFLPNQETPSFLARVEDELIPSYIGQTIADARTLQVDAVSGATFSSVAVMENIRRSLEEIPSETVTTNEITNHLWSLKWLLALLVAIAAAVLPLFLKNSKFRWIQLICNVLVLGFYTGTFVSYTTLTGVLAHGLSWQNAALLVLLVMALLYPLCGRRGHYCAWACPLGSAQELVFRISKRHISIPTQWLKYLNGFRWALWGVLMLLSWTGICLEWMDYELFVAFIWQSASWIVIALTAMMLLLSCFINRPYCRFLCPTGVIMKQL